MGEAYWSVIPPAQKYWEDAATRLRFFESGKTEPKKTMTTYRREDGEYICGEYSFVTELEWFEDDDESTELVKETWVLVSSEHLTYPERDLEAEDQSAWGNDYEDDIYQASDLKRYLGEQY